MKMKKMHKRLYSFKGAVHNLNDRNKKNLIN
jgi:hypothetical protein